MAPLTPYTYIQCPCSDPSHGADTSSSPADVGQDEDDRTFDPRAPRSNYSLYPIEYLLYCEDCHQIRCPRCVAEEIAAYYCPNCLFEVPFSNIRSEGNRCTRSCFQCPICMSPLTVNSLESAPNPNLLTAGNASTPSGPYILACSYCNWSSEEIGVKFDKPNGIAAQLAKVRNGGQARLTAKERREQRDLRGRRKDDAPILDEQEEATAGAGEDPDVETQFSNLLTFYKSQLAESSSPSSASALSPLGDLGFGSPSSLSRIMSMYTTGSGPATLQDRRSGKGRASPMREARDGDEGFRPARLDESAVVAKLRREGWDGTATAGQAAAQLPVSGGEPVVGGSSGGGGGARFVDALRPVPYLLRAKRSKRCPVCRHIISKPESKVTSTRFRIRLVAGNYIPSIAIRPLSRASGGGAGSRSTASTAIPDPPLLAPLKAVQYLLTFKNPIFDPVKVTLATPATTPGRFASKVTVLCPQFDIGANTDVWDDALRDGANTTASQLQSQQHQAEAGKVWERGRNWVSIVVEVVPASLRLDALAVTTTKKGAERGGGREGDVDLGPLGEDEDILEIPMFVRVEWESEAGNDEVGATPGEKDKEAKIKRELAYWCVLGIGRISQE